MNSVRTRLFLTISLLSIFFVSLSWSLTKLCLESYYLWQKKGILITSGKFIDDLYTGNPELISLELNRISNTLGAGIIIFGLEGQVKYSSFGPFLPRKGIGPAGAPPDPPPHVSRNKEFIDQRTALETQNDPMSKIDFIVLERRLSNGDRLHIRQPVAPISESASVAARFLIFTGLISIGIGCLWAFYFARRFTRPILDLNHIAQSMALLDFSQKAAIDRNDEIGKLGRSINHLSDQLGAAIAELNEKNQKLQADVEKERHLDKMRKEFVSNVSHELKTPLSLILGYAEGLKENVAQNEESRNYYCSIIIDEAEKMDRLVQDLLNLSQIESGVFQLNQESFDLVELLDELYHKYQPMITGKNLCVKIEAPTQCFVYGDRMRVEQILQNYLNNAMDHADGPPGVRITISASSEGYARISVFNSGRPIPSDSLDKIWTSFYKVDKARSRERGGHGLGLSIVRAIQELHNSRYGVENQENGVCFWFEIKLTTNV